LAKIQAARAGVIVMALIAEMIIDTEIVSAKPAPRQPRFRRQQQQQQQQQQQAAPKPPTAKPPESD